MWRSSLEGRASLADRTCAWLTQRIIDGTLQPGQRVSENELAEQLGVSRSPVREALRELARDRVVEIFPQRGTFITLLGRAEIDAIYRAKQLVESERTALAIEHFRDGDVHQLKEIAQRTRALTGDPRGYYETFESGVPEVMAARCPNQVINDLAASVRRRSLPYHGVAIQVPGLQDLLEAFLGRLVAAGTARDAAAARSAAWEFFEKARIATLAFVDARAASQGAGGTSATADSGAPASDGRGSVSSG
jgi:DNA-binding GntR family transcriptional regulator